MSRRLPGAGWLAASVGIALLALLPVAALLFEAARGDGALWAHLLQYVLPPAVRDTSLLLAGVGLIVIVLGTGSAWLVTAYDFPGRRLFEWALLLPLAVPTYIMAYAWMDLLHPIGPVQSGLRALLGLAGPQQLRFPEVRSLAGCTLVLGFVLYPYVYLTTRAMFLMQATALLEAGRTLGPGSASDLPAHRAAAGAPGNRGGHGAGTDGSIERHRRRRIAWRAHADRVDLLHVGQPHGPAGRGADRPVDAGGGGGPAGDRARRAAAATLCDERHQAAPARRATGSWWTGGGRHCACSPYRCCSASSRPPAFSRSRRSNACVLPAFRRACGK